jgi:hydrogenase maturation protease
MKKIIGLGNEFRHDDAVGLIAARRLRAHGVAAEEHTGDLATLIDRWSETDFLILIDAASSGTVPGTVHRLDVSAMPLPRDLFKSSTHTLDVADAIELSRALGTLPTRVLVFGVETRDFGPGVGLSPEIEDALALLIEEVLSCIPNSHSRRSPVRSKAPLFLDLLVHDIGQGCDHEGGCHMEARGTLAPREILAATDFSSQSMQAIKAAIDLAQHFNARLHVLHVVEDASKQVIREEKLSSFPLGPVEGTEIVRVISVGQIAPEIVKYARRAKVDLIVLGTHGRSGVTRILMGSVAEAVVRSAPCQVLTIGPKAQAMHEPTVPAERSESHCLVCAQPSATTICDACKAHIQGEAIERKRREEKAGHRGIAI